MVLRFLILFCFSLSSFADDKTAFDFKAVQLRELAQLYFDQASKSGYALCDDFLKSEKVVSFRSSGKGFKADFAELLKVHGFEVRSFGGSTFVCGIEPKKTELADMVYRVRNSDPVKLVESLRPFFITDHQSAGAGSSPTSVRDFPSVSTLGASDGAVIFRGPAADASRALSLLEGLDVDRGSVQVRATVLEVGSNSSEGSSLQLLASVLRGKLSAQVSGGGDFPNALSLTLPGLNLESVFSALESDSRFKILSSPFASVRHGQQMEFNSGQEVPVLGQIVTDQSGKSSQSVNYRPSGVILNVKPVIFPDRIEVEFFQQVSTFAGIQAGTVTAPTLNKREIKSVLSFKDGETIAIAGLQGDKEDKQRSGLFGLPFFKGGSMEKTELLILLQVTKI